MGHYDYLYETVTKEEIEEKIKKNNEHLQRLKEKQKKINADMNVVSLETKQVLENYLRFELDSWIKEANRESIELKECMKDFESGKSVQKHRII